MIRDKGILRKVRKAQQIPEWAEIQPWTQGTWFARGKKETSRCTIREWV